MFSQTAGDSNALARDDYERLPEAIKRTYSFEQYLWLSGEEKRNLVQTECEPEVG